MLSSYFLTISKEPRLHYKYCIHIFHAIEARIVKIFHLLKKIPIFGEMLTYLYRVTNYSTGKLRLDLMAHWFKIQLHFYIFCSHWESNAKIGPQTSLCPLSISNSLSFSVKQVSMYTECKTCLLANM